MSVAYISDAYRLLSPAVGTVAAKILFGIALLASGQNSTITGTLAGERSQTSQSSMVHPGCSERSWSHFLTTNQDEMEQACSLEQVAAAPQEIRYVFTGVLPKRLLRSAWSSKAEGVWMRAGQVVMEGFLRVRLPPWLRRILTRLIAVVPAAVVAGVPLSP